MLARRHIRPSTPGDGYTGAGTRVAPRWRDFPNFCVTRTVRLRNEHRGRDGTSTCGDIGTSTNGRTSITTFPDVLRWIPKVFPSFRVERKAHGRSRKRHPER